MANTTFVPGTVIAVDWAQDVNDFVYGVNPEAARATLGAAADAFVQTGTGAVERTISGKLSEFPRTPLDYEADGDGVADDTAAVQATLDAAPAGSEVLIPHGHTFLCGPLTVSKKLILRIDGVLKMKDATGTLLTIAADGFVLCGAGEIDLNETEFIGVNISGDDVIVENLTIRNMLGGAASVGSSSALYVSGGDRPRVSNVRIRDILRGTGSSPSQPRAMTVSFCTDAVVSDVQISNVWSGMILSSNTRTYVQNPVLLNTLATTDNGFYIIGGSDTYIVNPTIHGWNDEPVVFSGTTRAFVIGGQVINPTTSNSLGFEDSTDIGVIGTSFIGDFSTILKARNSNTSSTGIVLRNVYARGRFSDDIVSYNTGACNDVVIEGCTFDKKYDTSFTDSILLLLGNTDRFVIDRNTFILREDAAAPASDFTITLDCSSPSSFRANRLLNFTASARFRVNGIGDLVEADTLYNQANIDAKREINNFAPTIGGPKVLFGTAIPAAGTWNRGDIVWNAQPAAGGTAGWVCTTAGTPGTWKTFGSIAA